MLGPVAHAVRINPLEVALWGRGEVELEGPGVEAGGRAGRRVVERETVTLAHEVAPLGRPRDPGARREQTGLNELVVVRRSARDLNELRVVARLSVRNLNELVVLEHHNGRDLKEQLSRLCEVFFRAVNCLHVGPTWAALPGAAATYIPPAIAAIASSIRNRLIASSSESLPPPEAPISPVNAPGRSPSLLPSSPDRNHTSRARLQSVQNSGVIPEHWPSPSLLALEYVRAVRPEITDLLALGALPGADDLSAEQAERYAEAIERLPTPTAEEASALVDLLPPDESTSFGLAWSLVHAIESCPEWPVWDALGDETPWQSVLQERATGS